MDGVYTTDPRLVPEARKIDVISYDEMLELASVGAGVMHSRSIEFAKKFDVPLQVRSSFSDAEGTWIVPEADWMRDVAVCGAALVSDEARIHLEGVPDEPGVSHRIFSAIAEQNIVVDMIAQNVGSGGQGRHRLYRPAQRSAGDAWRSCGRWPPSWVRRSRHEEEVSKVSIVGTGMRTHTGVAERMFAALAAAEHQHEDDHHRRHQDLRPGRQGRRRAGLAGGSPGVSACTSLGRARACRAAAERARFRLRPAAAAR